MKRLTTGTLLLGFLAGGAITVTAQTPKIVVGIVVDQLRTDYLEQLRPYFGQNGFNRLIDQGVYLQDVDFRKSVSDAPTGAAVIYTGAWPAVNGVAGAEKLDGSLKRNVPTLASEGSKSRHEYSPEPLRLSTVADEIYIGNGPLTKIYSVAGDPQLAVVSAGHAGTAAVYLDDATGKWTAPAFYGTLPPAAGNRNRTSPPASKMSATVWRPLATAALPHTTVWSDPNFSYSFTGAGRDAVARYKQSAPFNSEVTDLAIDMIRAIQNGAKDQPGMVSVGYSLAPINFDYEGDNRPELADSYMRLDAEIGKLLEALDKSYGKGNAVVFLSSTGYADEPEIPETEAKLPTGEITLKKAESLLNSFLSAEYGNADYVALISGGKVFLDRKVAESKGIDIRRLREEAKNFLMRMGGVSEAFTLDEILRGDNVRTADMSLAVDPKNAPDITLLFTPGWTVTDDNVYPAVSKKVRVSSPLTPAFILAPDLEPELITYTVDATRLAPTITSLLRIRAPNGASSKPLTLKLNNNRNH